MIKTFGIASLVGPMAAALLLSAVWTGCARQSPESAGPPIGPKITEKGELNPALPPAELALLVTAGTEREVRVATRRDGESVSIEMFLHDELYDDEQYISRQGSFSLKSAAGEIYDPPMPLLKFPMNVGEKWEWSGVAIVGPERTEANAEIETSETRTYVCGVPVDAIRSLVRLTLPTANGPIQRQMTFFFSPDRGVFRREYGQHSVREPSCP
jgi:hypothetical protein